MFIFCIPWHQVTPDIIIYSRAQALSLTPSPRQTIRVTLENQDKVGLQKGSLKIEPGFHCSFLWREENTKTRKKIPSSSGENQQATPHLQQRIRVARATDAPPLF